MSGETKKKTKKHTGFVLRVYSDRTATSRISRFWEVRHETSFASREVDSQAATSFFGKIFSFPVLRPKHLFLSLSRFPAHGIFTDFILIRT